jgi:hypothetical protein
LRQISRQIVDQIVIEDHSFEEFGRSKFEPGEFPKVVIFKRNRQKFTRKFLWQIYDFVESTVVDREMQEIALQKSVGRSKLLNFDLQVKSLEIFEAKRFELLRRRELFLRKFAIFEIDDETLGEIKVCYKRV